jgi:hypothetical protein
MSNRAADSVRIRCALDQQASIVILASSDPVRP